MLARRGERPPARRAAPELTKGRCARLRVHDLILLLDRTMPREIGQQMSRRIRGCLSTIGGFPRPLTTRRCLHCSSSIEPHRGRSCRRCRTCCRPSGCDTFPSPGRLERSPSSQRWGRLRSAGAAALRHRHARQRSFLGKEHGHGRLLADPRVTRYSGATAPLRSTIIP
jgi:hypothetical protein